MTPKEKALDLVTNFYAISSSEMYYGMNWEMSKHCALNAVDEVLEECRLERDWYWEEVKQEIEKL